MNALIAFALLLVASVANGSLYGGIGLVGPADPGAVLKGPETRATLVGPDGSTISAAADSGALVAAPRAGGVVTAAVAPGWVGHGAPIGAAYAAPLAYAGAGTVINGPSGIIATPGAAHGYIAGGYGGLGYAGLGYSGLGLARGGWVGGHNGWVGGHNGWW